MKILNLFIDIFISFIIVIYLILIIIINSLIINLVELYLNYPYSIAHILTKNPIK